MNYGILFSTELQKMAYEPPPPPISGRQGRQGIRESEDAGNAFEQLRVKNEYERMANQTFAGEHSSSGSVAMRSPVTGTWVAGGAGRTLSESSANAQKAKAKILAKHPNAFTPPASRSVANR